jgi:transposase
VTAQLVAIRSGLQAQIHAVLAKAGVLIAASDLFGVTGRQRLAKVPLGPAYAQRIRSLLELIDILDSHQARYAAMIAERLHTHRGYHAIQQLPGIGPVLAAVCVAEIRGRAPFRRPDAPVLVGRFDPHTPRIGHRRSPRAHHQAGQQTRAVGRRGGHPAPAGHHQDRR